MYPFRIIPLTNSDRVVLVSPEDYEQASRFTWHLKKSAYVSYVSRCYKENRHVKTQRLHQFIMNPKKGQVVHHIDGDSLNNTRDNLKIETEKEHNIYHGFKHK